MVFNYSVNCINSVGFSSIFSLLLVHVKSSKRTGITLLDAQSPWDYVYSWHTLIHCS